MKQIILDSIAMHRDLITQFEITGVEPIAAASRMIIDSLTEGGCVYLCGNGGSAADCQHIAGEFVGRFRRQRRALPAVALTTDTSVMTAIGNDYSYEDIFSRPVEALLNFGDVLWAFSTSGRWANVIKAAKATQVKGGKVLSFVGRPGSPLEAISDVALSVDIKETSFVQEVHQLAYHIVCDLVEKAFAEKE